MTQSCELATLLGGSSADGGREVRESPEEIREPRGGVEPPPDLDADLTVVPLLDVALDGAAALLGAADFASHVPFEHMLLLQHQSPPLGTKFLGNTAVLPGYVLYTPF